MDYSILLKQIREKLFLTQVELADLLGVSFETVNRWENNKFQPSMKLKRKISEICKENDIEYKCEVNNEIYRK